MRALIFIFALAVSAPISTSLLHANLTDPDSISLNAFQNRSEIKAINALLADGSAAHVSHDLKGAQLTNLATGEKFKVLRLTTNTTRSASALIFETAQAGKTGVLPLQLIPSNYRIDISPDQLSRALSNAKPVKNTHLAENLL